MKSHRSNRKNTHTTNTVTNINISIFKHLQNTQNGYYVNGDESLIIRIGIYL